MADAQPTPEQVKEMSQLISLMSRDMTDMARRWDSVQRGSSGLSKSLGQSHLEFRTLIKDATKVEELLKNVDALSRRSLSVGTNRKQALEHLKQLEREAKAMSEALKSTRGYADSTGRVNKALQQIHQQMVKVERQGDNTWDADAVRRVNQEIGVATKSLANFQREMSKIQVGNLAQGFKQIGRAVNEAFDGRAMAALERGPLGGLIRSFRAGDRMKLASADVHKAMGERRTEVMKQQLASGRKRHLDPTFRRDRGAPTTPSRLLGSLRGPSAVSGSSPTIGGTSSGASPTATASGLVDGSGNPISSAARSAVGGRYRFKVGGRTASHLMNGVNSVLQSSGAAAGPVGREALIQGAGGMAGTALGFAGKAMPFLGAIQSIIALRDKVAAEDKKMDDVLSAGGSHAGPGGMDFANSRSMLNSSMSLNPFNRHFIMGQTQEKNLDLMKAVIEGGVSTGSTVNKRDGIDLGQAMEGRSGSGFMNAIMENSVYHGKSMGMGQDQSAKLTMKLMEKYGVTMSKTSDFFVHMDDYMEHSGITATKYLEVVDAITDQFADMNKSLAATVGVLNVLGKTGRMTGDVLKKTSEQITKPTEQTTSQKMFTASQLSSESKANISKTLGSMSDNDIASLRDSLGNANGGISGITKINSDFSNIATVESDIMRSDKDQPTKQRMIDEIRKTKERVTSQNASKSAYESGDASRIAGVEGLVGASMPASVKFNEQVVRSILQAAGMDPDSGDGAKLLGGDSSALSKVMSGRSGLLIDQLQKGSTFAGGMDLGKYVHAKGDFGLSGAAAIGSFADEGSKYSSLSGFKAAKPEQYAALLATQNARNPGGKGNEDDKVGQLIKDVKNNGQTKVLDEIAKMPATFEEVATTGSHMQKAMEALASEAAKERSRAEAALSSTRTRASADIFADAFSTLFNRLISVLESLGNFWGKKDGSSTGFSDFMDQSSYGVKRVVNMQEAVSGIKTEGMTPAKVAGVKAVKDLLDEFAGRVRFATTAQIETLTSDVRKKLKDLGINMDTAIYAPEKMAEVFNPKTENKLVTHDAKPGDVPTTEVVKSPLARPVDSITALYQTSNPAGLGEDGQKAMDNLLGNIPELTDGSKKSPADQALLERQVGRALNGANGGKGFSDLTYNESENSFTANSTESYSLMDSLRRFLPEAFKGQKPRANSDGSVTYISNNFPSSVSVPKSSEVKAPTPVAGGAP